MTGAFIQGRRTPDGPLVTYHRPGEEPLAFPDPSLDWGTPSASRTLALTLICNLVSPYLPTHVVDSFVERFLSDAPRDRWVITFEEIERWKAEHPDWVEEAERRRSR
jgi:hypothetical protein